MQAQQYTIGWICAIPTEFVTACAMLDEEHAPLEEQPRNDNNAYTLGRIGHHNVVIACLPKGKYGMASAASVAADMLNTFEFIRFGLMVGIAGGAPHDKHDIRLGDVVVGISQKLHGGVVAYDFGRAVQGQEFEITGSLNAPPKLLLTAISQLETYHQLKGMGRFNEFLSRVTSNPRLKRRYGKPNAEEDRLYKADYIHPQHDVHCAVSCDNKQLITRGERDILLEDSSGIHYGLIASSNRVIRDAKLRDKIQQTHGILCFEMEAAGLMNNFPCMVIRGICDYSDSHKNDTWQGYAAATAAAYAKELLQVISPAKVMYETTAAIVQTRSRASRSVTKSLYEEGRRDRAPSPASLTSSSASRHTLSVPPDPEIVRDIDIGQAYLDDKAKTPDLAERLKNAEKHFFQALGRLIEKGSSDVASHLLVYNGLMRVELNKTLIKARSPGEKKASLRQAFYFNQLALENARRMSNPEIRMAQTQMRRAILVARELELDCCQPRVDARLINEWRTNALKTLHDARQEMVRVGFSEIDRKLIAWADGWIARVVQISPTIN